MVFVASDIWEWGIFVYGALEIFNPQFQFYVGEWFDHVHRIFAIVFLILLLKLSSWRVSRGSISILAFTICTPLALLAFSPFPGWDILVRVYTLVLFGFSLYFGMGNIEDNSILFKKRSATL